MAIVVSSLGQRGGQGAAGVYDASTDSSGQASFIDSSTSETVMVHIRDLGGNALPRINVQYWDYTDAEMFIAEDPSGKYATALEIYPHNSEHLITMHISSDTPIVREVSASSEQGRATENIVKHAQDEWVYIGKRTPEQLDKEEAIISLIVAHPLKALMSYFNTAGKIAEASREISGWEEPEYYHVYRLVSSEGPGKITTAVWTAVPEYAETVEPKPIDVTLRDLINDIEKEGFEVSNVSEIPQDLLEELESYEGIWVNIEGFDLLLLRVKPPCCQIGLYGVDQFFDVTGADSIDYENNRFEGGCRCYQVFLNSKTSYYRNNGELFVSIIESLHEAYISRTR